MWNAKSVAPIVSLIFAVWSVNSKLMRAEDPPNRIPPGKTAPGTAAVPARPDSLSSEPSPEIVDTRLLRELGDRRLQMEGSVYRLAISPDSKLAATVNFSRAIVRIWDLTTGQLLQRLRSASTTPAIYSVVEFTRDGRFVIAGNMRGELEVWDLESGASFSCESRHQQTVQTVAISPDDRFIATAGADSVLQVSNRQTLKERIWSKQLGNAVKQQPGFFTIMNSSGITDLAFTTDGKFVVAGLSRSSISVLDATTGEVIREIMQVATPGTGQSANSGLRSLGVSPDGQRLMTGGNRMMKRDDVPSEVVAYVKNIQIAEAKMWDLGTGELIIDLTRDRWEYGWGISALSPDGQLVAQRHHDKLQLLNSQTGQVVRSILVPGSSGENLRFSPNGELIVTADDNAIAIFQVKTGERLFHDKPQMRGHIPAVAFSPGFELYLPELKEIATRLHEKEAELAEPLIATGGSDGRIHLWNAATQKHIREYGFGPHSNVSAIQFSEDGKIMAACGQADDSRGRKIGVLDIRALDKDDWTSIPFARRVDGMAFSPDGKRIVVTQSAGSIGDLRLELWECQQQARRIAEFPRNTREGLSAYKAMRFSPDGHYVFIAEYDGTLRRWDTSEEAEDLRFVVDWRPHANSDKPERTPWIGTAEFSADCRLLVTSTKDTIYLWDVNARQLQDKIVVPSAKFGFRMGISPDNTTLATAEINNSNDPDNDTIRLFDLVTLKEVIRLPVQDDRAISFAFSRDSRQLVTGLSGGSALVWDVSRPLVPGD